VTHVPFPAYVTRVPFPAYVTHVRPWTCYPRPVSPSSIDSLDRSLPSSIDSPDRAAPRGHPGPRPPPSLNRSLPSSIDSPDRSAPLEAVFFEYRQEGARVMLRATLPDTEVEKRRCAEVRECKAARWHPSPS
jgi:hypothetical protein